MIQCWQEVQIIGWTQKNVTSNWQKMQRGYISLLITGSNLDLIMTVRGKDAKEKPQIVIIVYYNVGSSSETKFFWIEKPPMINTQTLWPASKQTTTSILRWNTSLELNLTQIITFTNLHVVTTLMIFSKKNCNTL